MEIRSSARVGGEARALCLAPHISRDWTCRARRRLVVGVPLVGKLVGDAANWSKTARLASEGLDQGLLSSLS
jgi:hypothetical protein